MESWRQMYKNQIFKKTYTQNNKLVKFAILHIYLKIEEEQIHSKRKTDIRKGGAKNMKHFCGFLSVANWVE